MSTTVRRRRRGAVTEVSRNIDLRDSGALPVAHARAQYREIVASIEQTPNNLAQDVAWRVEDARRVLDAHGLPATVPDVGYIQQHEHGHAVHYAIKVVWAAHNVNRFHRTPEYQARCAIDLGAAHALLLATLQNESRPKAARAARSGRVEERQATLRQLATDLLGWKGGPLTADQRRRLRATFVERYPQLAAKWGADTQRKDEAAIGLR